MTHVQRDDVAGRSVVAVTLCGKELQVDDRVDAARALLARKPIKIVPVLDGSRYVGAVDAVALEGAAEEAAIAAFATALVPVATADESVEAALDLLDRTGGQRLVVLDAERERYVGVVCLRGDRQRLCVDTERLELTGRDLDGLGRSAAPPTEGVSG